jgi:hypothetical protein
MRAGSWRKVFKSLDVFSDQTGPGALNGGGEARLSQSLSLGESHELEIVFVSGGGPP